MLIYKFPFTIVSTVVNLAFQKLNVQLELIYDAEFYDLRWPKLATPKQTCLFFFIFYIFAILLIKKYTLVFLQTMQ